MKELDKKQIRPCLVSGLFYPDTEEELTSRLNSDMTGNPRGESRLILTPHGSYDTIGQCMGSAFSAVRDRPVEKVVLIGPVHREEDTAFLSLPEKAYFETPLGAIPIDRTAAEALAKASSLFVRNNVPHMEEHCLEVQLPYIKHLFPDAEILPILIGKLNRKQIRKAAEHLRGLYEEKGKSLLTVLSVNLSGFVPLEQAKASAENLIEMIRFPLQHSLMEEERNNRISTCGSVVLTLASELFPHAGPAQLLHMQNSCVSERGIEKGVFYGGFRWE